MMSEANFPLTIPVDPEHGGFRIAIVFLFVISGIAGYALMDRLLPGSSVNIIALVVGFAAAYVVTELGERYLKKRWRSGRNIEVDTEGVRITSKGKTQETIYANQSIEILTWRFAIKRRTRVPKGWFMIACALQQEDRCLAVYSFISPAQLEAWQAADRFTLLVSKKEMAKRASGSGREDLRLAGEQRRLMTAEQTRWMDGAEMTLQDFEAYLRLLETRFPEWTPLR